MTRPSIALCMIVKNEEENLPRLFESIQGCFDEVHITDTGSTDNTVEIAEAFGAKVHKFEWIQDFAAARNFSFSHATTDYIAWLDADDVLENGEAFKQFRDHVMMLADYWVAPYHYTSDANGKSLCTFSRERVIRRDRGMKWSYAIHEGIRPDSGTIMPRIDFVASWAVRHKRSDADLLKDRSRNLSIFEHMRKSNTLDSRMTYYYGKELFEAGKLIEAITEFQKANATTDLEMHDRVLSHQYLCYAYIQCNQFDRAIDCAHSGLMLAPTRAEFFSLIGDCYLKTGKLIEARPFFEASKGCSQASGPQGATAIFHHEATYTDYPRNQLARIHANMGDFDAAVRESEESANRYGSAEGKAILAEVHRLMSVTSGFKNAKPCEDIVITTPPQTAYEFDPDTYRTKATGGSETALIEMAYWLRQKTGRKVIVFSMRSNEKTFDGVDYRPASQVHDYFAANKPYFHVAWRHNIKLTDAPTYLWCHDLTTQGAENHANYDKILCLTEFHKNYVQTKQGIPSEKIHVTRNGIKPERFVPSVTILRDPNKFIFSSSPDRGLDRAMRVLDRVRVKYPNIKLHVYYGIEHLDRYGLGDMRKYLAQMMEERKDWVIYHGATQQDELMREFKSAAYCIQPSDWIETSMISAIERLCCGVYQIIRAVGGCVDTLSKASSEGMATLVYSDCITESEHDLYAAEVVKAIEQDAYKRVNVDPSQYSWEGVAEEWVRDLAPVTEGGLDAAG